MLAGQQFKKHDAQGINVAGGGDGLAPYLFGAGISRCERSKYGQGRFNLTGDGLGVQDFGNAEVQEFGRSIGSNENIAGLQVAMDDQPLMGVLDRGTYL